jgi:hypothetical protein
MDEELQILIHDLFQMDTMANAPTNAIDYSRS